MALNHKPEAPEAVGKASFHTIPAELKIIIISYMDLDPFTFRSVSLLDRQTHYFLKNHEFELVKNVVQIQNRLAGLLALPDRPTFKDYLSLQIEERSLTSVFRTLSKNFLYSHWVNACVVDSDDLEKPEGLMLMLRAGFYVHFRAARLKSALEKEDFIMNLSEVAWALSDQFSFLVMKAVELVALARKLKPLFIPSPHAAKQNREYHYHMVTDAVVRFALYSGMHALDYFFHWRFSTEDGARISDTGQWMLKFLTDNLEKSVLVKGDAPFAYHDFLMQTRDILTIELARNSIKVPGRSNIITLYEADMPGVTQASLDMIAPCPEVLVTPEDLQKSLGVKLDRRQYRAASAVIRLTGLKAAANASVSGDSDGFRGEVARTWCGQQTAYGQAPRGGNTFGTSEGVEL